MVMKMMVVVDVEMCVVCKMMGVIMTEVEGFVIVKGRAGGSPFCFLGCCFFLFFRVFRGMA